MMTLSAIENAQRLRYTIYIRIIRKYVSEIHNCTFTIAISHWPPYTKFPAGDNDTSTRYSYGVEPYLLRLIGEMAGFSWNIVLDKESKLVYPTVSADLKAVGTLNLLQNNKADVTLGGLILVPSRAAAFTYVYDLLPYANEINL